MSYTFCTVIVGEAFREQANIIVNNENMFTTPLSENGQLPITHFIASGAFENCQLNTLLNDNNIQKTVYFGEVSEALNIANLKYFGEVSEELNMVDSQFINYEQPLENPL